MTLDTQPELVELIVQCRKAAMDICGSPLEEVAPINLLLNQAADALEARIPQEDELREALKEIFAIVQDSALEQNYRIRDIIMNALRDQSVAALEGRSGE